MIFQANHDDEILFDVGKGAQVPETPVSRHNQISPLKKNEPMENDLRVKETLNPDQHADDADFDVGWVILSEQTKDSSEKEQNNKNFHEPKKPSGHPISPVTAVCFPQPAFEFADVCALEMEEKADFFSRVQSNDLSGGNAIKGGIMDMPYNDRPELDSMRKQETVNQSIAPKRDGVDSRVPSPRFSGGNDSTIPADIFGQIKERFNDFQYALNESKSSQPAFKAPAIDDFFTSRDAALNAEAQLGEISGKDSEQTSAAISPQVDLPDFKAFAGETVTEAGYRIVSLSGHVEQEHQAPLEKFLDKVMYQGSRNLLFDMSKLLSMSSSGWGVMVSCLQRLKKHGGAIAFCAMDGEVRQCFRVLELDKLFSTYNSIFEALRTIKQELESARAGGQKQSTLTAGSAREQSENADSLPLEEKIRRIIAETPDLAVREIGKKLKTGEYGNVSISVWSLQAKLRSMNLGTKEERFRFFRSA